MKLQKIAGIGVFVAMGWVSYIAVQNPRSIPLFRYLNIQAPDLSLFASKSHSVNARKNVEQNYQTEVVRVAEGYDLPPSYLLALIILECGGHDPCGSRFEPKRFRQLKNLRDGKRRKFESLRRTDLEGKTDDQIRQLATSWGTFQIMGYHTLTLSTEMDPIDVDDLTGARAIEIGVHWIDVNYGSLLRDERYKDAFHMHNTGRLYPKIGGPKTYDPQYIPNGLAHMSYFLGEGEDEDTPTAVATPPPESKSEAVELIEFDSVEDPIEGETVLGWQVPPSND